MTEGTPRNPAYLILSPESWTESAQTNKHHLAQELAARSRVLYVNALPTQRRRFAARSRTRRASEHLYISDGGLGLPVRLRQSRAWAAQLHAVLACAGAARISHRVLHGGPIVALVYFPLPPSLLRRLRADVLVYHCVDFHASFPAWQDMASTLLRWERQLTEQADVVFASSSGLAEHLGAWRPDVVLLENVGDVDLFAAAGTRSRTDERPPNPSFFFHGTFSEHKVDFDFLARIADRFPSSRLSLVGAVADETAKRRLASLQTRANVDWRPAMNQTAVTEQVSRADILLLPYALNNHTAHVFPIKLTEYLATGMPIISTRLPAVERFAGDRIYYAGSSEDLRVAVDASLRHDATASDAQSALVKGRTWSARALEIESYTRSALGSLTRRQQP